MGDIRVPGTPEGYRGIDGAIAEAFAFGCKVEDIGHEHLRDRLLIVENVAGTVHPADGGPNRGLHFTDRHGETVDQQDDIQPLSTGSLGIYPLVGHHKAVVLRAIVIEKANADRPPVLVERKAVFLKNQLFKALILRHQIMRAHCGDQRTQLINDRIGMVRVLGDAGVQADQRIPQVSLHHNFGLRPGQFSRGDILPAILLESMNHHIFYVLFTKTTRHSSALRQFFSSSEMCLSKIAWTALAFSDFAFCFLSNF